jgi:hypothetical protein
VISDGYIKWKALLASEAAQVFEENFCPSFPVVQIMESIVAPGEKKYSIFLPLSHP